MCHPSLHALSLLLYGFRLTGHCSNWRSDARIAQGTREFSLERGKRVDEFAHFEHSISRAGFQWNYDFCGDESFNRTVDRAECSAEDLCCATNGEYRHLWQESQEFERR